MVTGQLPKNKVAIGHFGLEICLEKRVFSVHPCWEDVK